MHPAAAPAALLLPPLLPQALLPQRQRQAPGGWRQAAAAPAGHPTAAETAVPPASMQPHCSAKGRDPRGGPARAGSGSSSCRVAAAGGSGGGGTRLPWFGCARHHEFGECMPNAMREPSAPKGRSRPFLQLRRRAGVHYWRGRRICSLFWTVHASGYAQRSKHAADGPATQRVCAMGSGSRLALLQWQLS